MEDHPEIIHFFLDKKLLGNEFQDYANIQLILLDQSRFTVVVQIGPSKALGP